MNMHSLTDQYRAAWQRLLYWTGRRWDMNPLCLLPGALLLLPSQLFRMPGVGLDASYNIAIHLAWLQGLTFGKDFLLTYGPLGILLNRLPIAVSPLVFALMDLYLYIQIIRLLIFLLRRSDPGGQWLVLAAVFIFQMGDPYGDGILKTMFILTIFMIYLHGTTRSFWTLLNAGVMACLAFYIKVDFGLPLFLLLVAYLLVAWLIAAPDAKRYLALFAAGLIGTVTALSFLLNTSLPGFLAASYHLAISFNDAMSLPLGVAGAPDMSYLFLALSILAAFLVFVFYRYKQRQWEVPEAAILALVAAFLFISFKYGFVRADAHILSFFYSAPLIITMVYAMTAQHARQTAKRMLWLAVLFSFPVASGVYDMEFLTGKITRLPGYFSALVAGRPQLQESSDTLPVKLPRRVLDRIDKSSVDVLPWEISMIYWNGLNYNPRPVVQSYTAYDGYLDRRNYEKYLSTTAPDYLIYTVGEIDGRHPFFTESLTRKAILANYEVVDSFGDYLLFAKRGEAIPFTDSAVRTAQAELGQFIEMPDDSGLLMLNTDLQYNLWGRLARFFYKPPMLHVTVKFSDGSERKFRAIKTMINSPVLANRMAVDAFSASHFFESTGRLGIGVKAIRFEDEKGWGFRKSFTYQLTRTEYKVQPSPARMPELLDAIPGTGQLKGNFDAVNGGYLRGWAFIPDLPSLESRIWIVLLNQTRAFKLQTIAEVRNDISRYAGVEALYDYSGFQVQLDSYALPPATYRLGILVENGTQTALSWSNYTYTR